jgi:bifunctional DNase/RNase
VTTVGGADAPPGAAAPGDEPGRWRLVTVASVGLDLPDAYPRVVLQEQAEPWRRLVLPVGLAEGTAIAAAWKSTPTPRPLTHQLVAELLQRQGVAVEAVRITAIHEGNYLAELDTMGAKGRQVVSCRPSDGIALALRRQMATPILVAAELLEEPAP